ncbi:MAG: N-acetyltransferase [Thermoleophilia bacterium]
MHVEEAWPCDLEDVLAVERAAFGGCEEVELVRALLEDATARPVLSLLARQNSRALGHILFTEATIDPAQDVRCAILAPLAVTPEAQGQGVGGKLIDEGVRRLTRAGVGLVFVLGHVDYYPRHGFVPAGEQGLEPPYSVTPREAWMVRPIRPDLLGNVRGTVRCAKALDRPELWRE